MAIKYKLLGIIVNLAYVPEHTTDIKKYNCISVYQQKHIGQNTVYSAIKETKMQCQISVE